MHEQARRSPGKGLLHDSRRGVQYAGDDYPHLLASHGTECSMSGKGGCPDNAAMEGVRATPKAELVNHERYATREQAGASIFEYFEVSYNRHGCTAHCATSASSSPRRA